MKAYNLLGLFALWEPLTTARLHPTNEMSSASKDPYDNFSLTQPVERQVGEICQIVNTAITAVQSVPEEWRAVAAYTGIASVGVGFSAYSTCEAWTNAEKCEAKGAAIGSYVAIAISGVVIWNNRPTRGIQIGQKRHDTLQESYSNYLLERGMDFESVNIMSLATRSNDEDDDGGATIQILGLRDANGLTSDHQMSFGARTALSHISFPATSMDGGLERRANGPGFKISYEFTEVATGVLLNEDDIDALCFNVGRDWAKRADADHEMGSYMATLELGTADSVTVLITPETGDNWNEEWESLEC